MKNLLQDHLDELQQTQRKLFDLSTSYARLHTLLQPIVDEANNRPMYSVNTYLNITHRDSVPFLTIAIFPTAYATLTLEERSEAFWVMDLDKEILSRKTNDLLDPLLETLYSTLHDAYGAFWTLSYDRSSAGHTATLEIPSERLIIKIHTYTGRSCKVVKTMIETTSYICDEESL